MKSGKGSSVMIKMKATNAINRKGITGPAEMSPGVNRRISEK